MKTAVTFNAESRATKGKGSSRQLRREGRIPGVLYGKGQEPVSFSINEKDFLLQYMKGGINNKLVDIQLEGKSYHVLPREVQLHPVSDKPEHVDFLKVDANSRVHVDIPVRLKGAEKCPGVKRGGAINVVRHTIEMICSPDSIPSFVSADVSAMNIGDSLHISAVELPKGVTPVITDRDFTVITVTGRGKDEDAEEAAAKAAAATAAEGAVPAAATGAKPAPGAASPAADAKAAPKK